MKETELGSLGWKDPLEKGIQPASIFLPGEFHAQRKLAGYSPWGYKESDMTEQLKQTDIDIILICYKFYKYA